MPKRIVLRALTTEEDGEINRLVASRKEPLRLVQRARIIKKMADDASVTATEPTVGRCSVHVCSMHLCSFKISDHHAMHCICIAHGLAWTCLNSGVMQSGAIIASA